MKQEKIYACKKCRIPLTEKLVREIDGKKFCYYCARRYSNRTERRSKNNGI